MEILTEDQRIINLEGKGFGVSLNEIKFYSGPGNHAKPIRFENNKKALEIMAIIVAARDRGVKVLDLKLL